MSIALLELAAATLADLLPEVVFLGGATVSLWITDPGALDGLFGALRADQGSQQRADTVVVPALRPIKNSR